MDYRRVRHLRLRAHGADEARHASIILEDALRTADVPNGSSSRMFFVRCLNVGRLPADISLACASQQVEKQLGEILSRAVFAASPGADAAPAVYFLDSIQALTVFVRRLSTGDAVHEWFWPLVIPGWRASAGRAHGLRRALIAAGDVQQSRDGSSHPAARQSALLATLLEESPVAFDMLLAALLPVDGPTLLAQSGLGVVARESPMSPEISLVNEPQPQAWREQRERPAPLPMISTDWESTLQRWASRWEPLDDRFVWLSSMALVAGHPARLAQPTWLNRAARQLLARAVETAGTLRNAPIRALSSGFASRRPELEHRVRVKERAASTNSQSFTDFPERLRGMELSPAGQESCALTEPESSHRMEAPVSRLDIPRKFTEPLAKHSDPGLFTQWSGLYFLLSGLIRLGLPGFLDEHSEWIELALPQRILYQAAARSGVQVHDPILTHLVLPLEIQGDGLPFVAPSAWAGLLTPSGPRAAWRLQRHGDLRALCSRGGLPFVIWKGPKPDGAGRWIQERPAKICRDRSRHGVNQQPLDIIVAAWVSVLRRWVRMTVGLSLHELLRRPGWLSFSRTHLDVAFPLVTVDLCIRRAGLDLDPGWLPWFGQVVQFHYLEQ